MDDEKKSLQSRDLEIENEENEDFQIIFDYLPKISFYQAVIVFLTGYCNVAAGSLQLAQIILQANPGNIHLHTNITYACSNPFRINACLINQVIKNHISTGSSNWKKILNRHSNLYQLNSARMECDRKRMRRHGKMFKL